MRKLEYPTAQLPDGDKRFRSLEVNSGGDLVFEQTDLGARTAQVAPNGGDSDYEYWITVKAKDVNQVLLELIREKFEWQDEFEEWLKSKKIKYNFFSY